MRSIIFPLLISLLVAMFFVVGYLSGYDRGVSEGFRRGWYRKTMESNPPLCGNFWVAEYGRMEASLGE